MLEQSSGVWRRMRGSAILPTLTSGQKYSLPTTFPFCFHPSFPSLISSLFLCFTPFFNLHLSLPLYPCLLFLLFNPFYHSSPLPIPSSRLEINMPVLTVTLVNLPSPLTADSTHQVHTTEPLVTDNVINLPGTLPQTQ